MGMTSGERSALWRMRQREDPQKHREYKEKERERYKRRKENGQIKPVSEMNTREKRKVRRNWRVNQRKKRERDSMLTKHVAEQLSPPQSPGEIDEAVPGTQKKRGRPRTRKGQAQAYRELFKLRIELDKERRLKERYKKRSYRLSKSSKLENEIETQVNSKLKSKDLRKALTLHLIMVRNLKKSYDGSSNKEKKKIKELVWANSRLIKIHKLGRYTSKTIGIKKGKPSNSFRRYERLPSLLKKKVVTYFERDDNSRILAGKKSTITRHGEKHQIRLLNDSIKNIHAKFIIESENKMSYSLFCQLKPFWVIKPLEKHRQTCLCRLHENIQFKLYRLFQEKVLDTSDLDTVIEKITCNSTDKRCMYRECLECKVKSVQLSNADGRQVSWFAWKSIREQKSGEPGKEETQVKMQSKTVKEKQFGTLENLGVDVNNDLPRLCKHVYNIRHQYSKIRELKSTLDDKSAIIHIDFSENYNCKYVTEIQSMHFGASQRQITLHTGVLYIKNQTISFCTISDCLKHGPPAIWAHLSPILEYLKSLADIKHVHFCSDGPTTQYRSKTNFFLFSKFLFHFGFEKGTWNFWEAGHGKGAPDGIGAAIKRQADRMIHEQKKDIMKATDLIEGLKSLGTKVKLFEVEEKEIIEIENKIQAQKIVPVPQTMKIHQVVVTEPYMIMARELSCFCSFDCQCFDPWVTSLKLVEDEPQNMEMEQEGDRTCAPKCILKPSYDESLIGRYVVVTYDNLPYPDVILDVDEGEIEVKVMHKVGTNRYFWPLIDDVLWYEDAQVLTLLETPPEPVTKRHCQINLEVWREIEKVLNF